MKASRKPAHAQQRSKKSHDVLNLPDETAIKGAVSTESRALENYPYSFFNLLRVRNRAPTPKNCSERRMRRA